MGLLTRQDLVLTQSLVHGYAYFLAISLLLGEMEIAIGKFVLLSENQYKLRLLISKSQRPPEIVSYDGVVALS